MSQQPTLEQLFAALERADAAGDEAAAREFAAMIREERNFQEMQTDPNAPLRGTVTDGPDPKQDPYYMFDGVPGLEGNYRPEVLGKGLVDATVNQFGAAADAVAGAIDFPLDVADGVNSLVQQGIGATLGGGLRAIGSEEAASRIDRSVNNLEALRNSRVRAGDLTRQAIPTPEGMEAARFTGQLVAGMMLPGGPKAKPNVRAPQASPKTNAQEVIEEGQKRGVRVMTSDVSPPRGFTSKVIQATGERIPYAGTGGPRVAQMEERVNAVRDFAREFGVEGGENYLEGVAEDFVKTRGAALTRLKGAKDSVISAIDQPFTEAPNATRAIAEEVRRLRGIDAQEYAPVIERLQRFGENLTSGKSLEQIEGQRRLLGDLFSDPNLASIKTDGQKAINAIYGPLREDMGAFIQRNAGADAFKKWKGANSKLANMAGDLSDSAFRRVLNGADMTPEKVSGLLFSKNPSEVRRLYRSLSASGRNKAKSAVVFRAFDKAVDGDDLSPAKFRSEIERLAAPIGVVFDKTDQAGIEGLSRLLKATQRASVAGTAPPTGVQNTQIIGATVLTDMMGGMGGATTAAGLAGMGARLYESATVRNLMVALSKTKPGSRAESAVVARIEGVIASQAGLRADDAARAVNDNVLGSAVAEDRVPNE